MAEAILFGAAEVNRVLRLVKSLSDDGNVQLSVLTVALLVACRGCGVTKENALAHIKRFFDDHFDLVEIDE